MPSTSQPHNSSTRTADKAAALALTPVSRETEARLDRYVDLLLEWQAKTNLVAPSTLPHLWTRHIADSLQLAVACPIRQGLGGSRQRRWLPRCRARLRACRNRLALRSIWSSAMPRRLPSCARRSGSPAAPGAVHLADIGDNVDRVVGKVDCVTARAVAPLHQLIGFRRAVGEKRCESSVSKRPRCRGRIDRSH